MNKKIDALAKLSAATQALAEAKSLDEVKKIHNIAQAAETYARAAKLGLEAQNHAAEVKLRAERRAGEMLERLERNIGGDRKSTPNVGHCSEYGKVLEDTDTTRQDASRWQTIAGMEEEKFEGIIGEAKEKKIELTSALMLKEAQGPHVSHNTGEIEWITPPDIIEAARKVMGSIGCDPASNERANKIIKANIFFTAEIDGLSQVWKGNVWMNPPYSQSLVDKFAEAVSAKYESGEISQACILVNNATETAWFQRMLILSSEICFIRGRIKFINAEGEIEGSPLQGQVIIYFGENHLRFHEIFSLKGIVLDGPGKNKK